MLIFFFLLRGNGIMNDDSSPPFFFFFRPWQSVSGVNRIQEISPFYLFLTSLYDDGIDNPFFFSPFRTGSISLF